MGACMLLKWVDFGLPRASREYSHALKEPLRRCEASLLAAEVSLHATLLL